MLISSFPPNAPIICSSHILHAPVIIPFFMQWNLNAQRSTKLIGSCDVFWLVFDGAVCASARYAFRTTFTTKTYFDHFITNLCSNIMYDEIKIDALLLIHSDPKFWNPYRSRIGKVPQSFFNVWISFRFCNSFLVNICAINIFGDFHRILFWLRFKLDFYFCSRFLLG